MAAAAGGGGAAGGAGGAAAPEDAVVRVWATNLNAGANPRAALGMGGAMAGRVSARSDVGNSFILFAEYRSAVTLTSLTVKAPDAALAPTRIKLFVNRPDFGFDDAEDPAAEEVRPSAADAAAGKTLRLKPGKFAAVHTITVYVENEAGESVGVQSIALGVKSNDGGADVSKIKQKGPEES